MSGSPHNVFGGAYGLAAGFGAGVWVCAVSVADTHTDTAATDTRASRLNITSSENGGQVYRDVTAQADRRASDCDRALPRRFRSRQRWMSSRFLALPDAFC